MNVDSNYRPDYLDSSDHAACLLFEERLQELLDQRLQLTTDPVLNQHANVCEECASLREDYQDLFVVNVKSAGCEAWTKIDDPTLKERLPHQSANPNWTRGKLAWSFAPSFVALLIVVVSMTFNLKSGERDELRMLHSAQVGRVSAVNTVSMNRDALSTRSFVAQAGMVRFDPILETFFVDRDMLIGFREYPGKLYGWTQEGRHLDAKSLARWDVLQRVSNPLERFHRLIPFRGDFTVIPQIKLIYRLSIGLYDQLIDQAKKATETDLGNRLWIYDLDAIAKGSC